MNSVPNNSFIDDFYSAIDDFEAFNKQSRQRNLDLTQQHIILKQKQQNLKLTLNALEFNPNITTEEKFHVYLDAIPKFVNLMNAVSLYREYKDIWYELKSYLNVLLLNLTDNPGQFDIWRYTASANIIAHILTTMEKVDDIPTIPVREHREYEEKIRITFNTLFLSARIYTVALSTLYTISLKEFLQWAEMAFWHHHLLNKLFDTIHIPTIANIFHDNIQDFYRWFYFNIHARCNIFVLTFTLLRMINTEKLQNIQTFGILTNINATGLAKTIDQTVSFINSFLTFVDTEYKNGHINANDDPATSIWITNIHEYLLYLTFFQEFLLFIEKDLFSVEPERKISFIDHFLNKILVNIKYIEHSLPSREKDFAYIHVIKLGMALAGYKAYLTTKKELFKHDLAKFQILRETLDPKEFPEIYFFEELTKVWVYSKIGTEAEIISVIENLLIVRNNLVRRSRDYIAATFLLSIITYISRKDGSQTLALKYLDDIWSLGMEEANACHLKNSFSVYWQALKRFFSGELSEPPKIPVNTKINPFDPLTWVIPTFSTFFDFKSQLFAVYLPFNCNTDGIIE